MTSDEWTAEVRRRIAINEGCRPTMYRDSLGVATIAVGFNLERADAPMALEKCGVTDVAGVIKGDVALTDAQIDALFSYSLAPILSEARQSVPGFDQLSDARRFVVCDMIFNLGAMGWFGFATTRHLIAQGIAAHDDPQAAHAFFGQAADHMAASAWARQVGLRAKRNCAMMRRSTWVEATGDGSV